MNGRSQRRSWTAERKLRLVIESLTSENKVAEICRREGLAPNQLYDGRKKLLGSAEAVFARKPRGDGEDPRIERLTNGNTRMKA